jgi:hypothetical protein
MCLGPQIETRKSKGQDWCKGSNPSRAALTPSV